MQSKKIQTEITEDTLFMCSGTKDALKWNNPWIAGSSLVFPEGVMVMSLRYSSMKYVRSILRIEHTVTIAAALLLLFTAEDIFAGGRHPTPRSRTRHDFFLGTVWKNNTTEDPYFARYWNQVTTENGGKWKNAEPERDRMNWEDLDNAYNFAVKNDMPFRFHTLIWGQSHPIWLLKLSPKEQLEETEEWFALVAERYSDIDFVDVVNEPIHEQPFNLDVYGGTGETGFDWVITIFEMARQYFPHAALEINDYSMLKTDSLTGIYARLAELLKSRRLIDAIGIQAHNLEKADPENVRANLSTLADTGLPLYITELTVAIRDDEKQLEQMKKLVTVMTDNLAVKGITTWGYFEGAIYSPGAMLLRSDGTERPAMTWLQKHYAELVR